MCIRDRDYTVYVGMFNPTGWVESGKTRLADIKINGETLQTGYNYYTSCTGKGDTLAFTGLKSDADGVLTVEVAANANTTSAVQVLSLIHISCDHRRRLALDGLQRLH